MSSLLFHINKMNEAYKPASDNFKDMRVEIYVHCCFCACLKNKWSIVSHQSSVQSPRSCSLMKVGSLHTGAFCSGLTFVSLSIFFFCSELVQLFHIVSLFPGDGV